jgi:hypothetical protein
MVSISLIIFFSVVLFVYWFRYSCLLILQTRVSSYGVQHVSASSLSFPLVQERLKRNETGVELLDELQRDLVNDYRVVCFLLRCSSENGVSPIERRMLMLDYWIMRGWYSLARRMARAQARKALEEISNIVSYFAHSVGRCSPQHSEA